MPRMYTDCREYPNQVGCTVAISADNRNELVEAAVQHAVRVHKHQDTPQVRAELGKMVKTGSPP